VTAKKTNPIFMNGVPELVLLKLLADQEMYGYEIVKAIQERSKNILSFGEGCVYPILHYLSDAGFVKVRNEVIHGRNRIFYQTTPKGRKRLSQLADEWTRISQGIANLWENEK
jgi:PadR family transcriptional regulator PadR